MLGSTTTISALQLKNIYHQILDNPNFNAELRLEFDRLMNQVPFSSNYGFAGDTYFVNKLTSTFHKSGSPFHIHCRLLNLSEHCYLGVDNEWLQNLHVLLRMVEGSSSSAAPAQGPAHLLAGGSSDRRDRGTHDLQLRPLENLVSDQNVAPGHAEDRKNPEPQGNSEPPGKPSMISLLPRRQDIDNQPVTTLYQHPIPQIWRALLVFFGCSLFLVSFLDMAKLGASFAASTTLAGSSNATPTSEVVRLVVVANSLACLGFASKGVWLNTTPSDAQEKPDVFGFGPRLVSLTFALALSVLPLIKLGVTSLPLLMNDKETSLWIAFTLALFKSVFNGQFILVEPAANSKT
jgi:hypothetical protein